MGNKWEVEAWVRLLDDVPEESAWAYHYEQVYYGDSLWRALVAMRQAKKTSGCARLSWRG